MEKISMLQESRKHGWASAETAPGNIQGRIIEIRSAILAGRPVPAPSRFYIAEAEKRNLTLPRTIERQLFPRRAVRSARVVFRSVPNGMCMEEHLEVTEMRSFKARAQKQAAVIAASAPKRLSAEEQRQIDNERRRCFPWER